MSDPISRRQFFRLRLRDVRRASTPSDAPVVRPPGAMRPDTMFMDTCRRCRACSEACPPDVIKHEGPGGGRGEGTPYIEPAVHACRWCTDFPCISACPSGALRRMPGAPPTPVGTVRWLEDHCLTSHGTLCEDCATVCPPDVHAIRMVDRKPVLDPVACVGCGLCIEHCPSEPVALVPAARA